MRVLRILPENRAGRSTLTEKLTVKWMRDTMRMIRGMQAVLSGPGIGRQWGGDLYV